MRGNLRAERARRGLTREQVAEEIGVGVQSVYRWENGKAMPRGEKLLALAAFYDCDPDYLFEDTDGRFNVEEDAS